MIIDYCTRNHVYGLVYADVALVEVTFFVHYSQLQRYYIPPDTDIFMS